MSSGVQSAQRLRNMTREEQKELIDRLNLIDGYLQLEDFKKARDRLFEVYNWILDEV